MYWKIEKLNSLKNNRFGYKNDEVSLNKIQIFEAKNSGYI
jgi:hypothetical protein